MSLSLTVSIDTRYALYSAGSGILPLIVQASARGSFAQSDYGVESLPEVDIHYTWDFGDETDTSRYVDPATGALVSSATKQRGPHAFHVYKKAGTYVVTCAAYYRDPITGTWITNTSTSSSITVIDPSTLPEWDFFYYDAHAVNSEDLGTSSAPFTSLERVRQVLAQHGLATLYVASGSVLQAGYSTQTVTLAGSGLGGNFTLSYGGNTTDPIAYNATGGAVQAAINNIFDAGAVVVSGGSGGPWTLTFYQAMTTLVTSDSTNITGAGVSLTVSPDTGPVLTMTDLKHLRVRRYTPVGSTHTGRPIFRLHASATGKAVVNIHADASVDAANEVQVVTLVGSVSGGYFKLGFEAEVTGQIAYDATNTDVKNALESLSNVAVGDVAVTGGVGGPWTVTFQNGLGNLNVKQLTVAEMGLTGTEPGVSVATTTYGSPGHTKVNDVLFEDVEFDGNNSVGSLGADFTVSGTPGNHEDIYFLNCKFGKVLGNVVRVTTTLTGGGLGPTALGIVKSYLDHGTASSAGHTVSWSCLDWSLLAANTFTGGNGNETNDHHIGWSVIGTTTAQTRGLILWNGFLPATRKNFGVAVSGGQSHIAILNNYFTGLRGAVSVTRDTGDATHANPTNVLIDSNDVGNMGLASYSYARGVYVRTAGNVVIRNTRFYENGYANGQAQAVGADVEVDDALGLEAVNDVQTVAITGGTPVSGSFVLYVNDQYVTVAYDASAATVKTDIAALSKIGTGNVDVTGSALPGGTLTVTFQGSLANANLPRLRIGASTLSTGTAVVSQVSEGTGAVRIEHNSFYRSYGNCAAPHIEIDDTRRIQIRKNAFQYMGSSGVGGSDPARSIIRFRSSAYSVPARDEKQEVSITGTPSGGSFKLSFTGSAVNTLGAQVTGNIAYNATREDVQTALEALAAVAPGDVEVTGGPLPATPVVVAFRGAWASQDVNTMTVDTNALTPSGTPVVTTVVAGSSGLVFMDGNAYWSPNLVRDGGIIKPFALSDVDLVTLDGAGANWRNAGNAAGDAVYDAASSYIEPEFRNPGSGNFEFGATDALIDLNSVNVGLRFDYAGHARAELSDPGCFEYAGDAGNQAYVYQPANQPNLPAAGGWDYLSGDVRYIEAGEPLEVTGVPETEVDNRPHRHLAQRDNILGDSVDGLLIDVNNAFCSPPQAGSQFSSPHRSIEAFMRVATNPDGTIRPEGLDLDALGFLRIDGQNYMLDNLDMGDGSNRIIHLSPGVDADDAMQMDQGVKRVGDSMSGTLSMTSGALIDMGTARIVNLGDGASARHAMTYGQGVKRAGDTVTGSLEMTGDATQVLDMGSHKIVRGSAGVQPTDYPIMSQVLLLTGGYMTGNINMVNAQINMGGGHIDALGVGTQAASAIRRDQAVIRTGGSDGVMSGQLSFTGTIVGGAIELGGNKISGSGAASFGGGSSTDVPQFKQTLSADYEDTKKNLLHFKEHQWITNSDITGFPVLGTNGHADYHHDETIHTTPHTYSAPAPESPGGPGFGYGIDFNAVPYRYVDGSDSTYYFDGKYIRRKGTGLETAAWPFALSANPDTTIDAALGDNPNEITGRTGNIAYNLPWPVNGPDAANKAYVDYTAWKIMDYLTNPVFSSFTYDATGGAGTAIPGWASPYVMDGGGGRAHVIPGIWLLTMVGMALVAPNTQNTSRTCRLKITDAAGNTKTVTTYVQGTVTGGYVVATFPQIFMTFAGGGGTPQIEIDATLPGNAISRLISFSGLKMQ